MDIASEHEVGCPKAVRDGGLGKRRYSVPQEGQEGEAVKGDYTRRGPLRRHKLGKE